LLADRLQPEGIAMSGLEQQSMEADAPSIQRQRVLVVEDQAALLEAVTMAFTRAGRDVVSCRTFEEAREHLLTGPFDALLTDVRLGAFNGLQLAVMARDRHPQMKIIVFSGFDDPVLREEARQLGASYVVKPVGAERLLELL
jgi:DNA-binding response OmpR family regulator